MTEVSYFLSYSQRHHSHSRLPMPSVVVPPVLSLLGLLQTALALWSIFSPHAEVGLHLLSRSHNTMAPPSLESCPHLLLPDPALMANPSVHSPTHGPSKQPWFRTEKRPSPTGHHKIGSKEKARQREGPALEICLFSLCSRSI